MKICRFNDDRLGVVLGEEVADVTAATEELGAFGWPLPSHDVFIANIQRLLPAMAALAETGERQRLEDVKLLSPVANPGKIIGAPANYPKFKADGVQKRGIADIGLFLKANSSMVGPSQGIPGDACDRIPEFEGELSVVIGKAGYKISVEEALDYAAAYTIGLDMAIRGSEDKSFRKSMNGFSPLGPWLVTPDEFGDVTSGKLDLWVNDELKQSTDLGHMIYGVAKLISYASEFYTLQPGDVIMTGTPQGSGPVHVGDVIRCSVERIGTLEIAVVAE